VKSKPGIAYATSGAGSQQHMAGEWFAKLVRDDYAKYARLIKELNITAD
jgi:hypothetical protein